MKLLKYSVLALVISPIFFMSSGCDDNAPTTTTTTGGDTTPVLVLNNKFQIALDKYELDIDKNATYGYYRQADGLTFISIVGNSVPDSDRGIVSGRGEVEIRLKGGDVGKWKQADQDDVELEVAIGEGVRRKEYSFDDQSNIIVEITQYDSVGGVLKGKFSGTLKSGINTGVVKGGQFEVERAADQ